MNLLEQSARVALAAFLHDIGKLAERAGIDHAGRLAAHKTLYCPWHQVGTDTRNGYPNHIHATYTGLAWTRSKRVGISPTCATRYLISDSGSRRRSVTTITNGGARASELLASRSNSDPMHRCTATDRLAVAQSLHKSSYAGEDSNQ